MISIQNANQIFYYQGESDFPLANLKHEVKGKISAIYKVSESGLAFQSWRPSGIVGFSNLVNGEGYLLVGTPPFQLDISASEHKDQDNYLIDKIHVFFTYQGCSNFNLSDLSPTVKGYIDAIYTVSDSGNAFLSWRPSAALNSFTTLRTGKNYLIVSKFSGFVEYDLELPPKCSSS